MFSKLPILNHPVCNWPRGLSRTLERFWNSILLIRRTAAECKLTPRCIYYRIGIFQNVWFACKYKHFTTSIPFQQNQTKLLCRSATTNYILFFITNLCLYSHQNLKRHPLAKQKNRETLQSIPVYTVSRPTISQHN